MREYRAGLTLAVALMMVSLGCTRGNQTHPVSGKVTLADGSPATGAGLSFVDPAAGVAASAQVGKDGEYELSTYAPLDGAPEGTYTVCVHPPYSDEGAAVAIYAKYRDPKTTPLTCTVKAGDNIFDIRLK